MSQCGARRKKTGGLGPDLQIYAGRKKTQRGRGYGFSGVIGTNGAGWSANNTSDVGRGGRRKKAGRRTRKKTRGGGSTATVGYGFAGQGSRGLADAAGYNSNPPGPPGFMGK